MAIKLGIRPQHQPILTSQNAQDVLDQSDMIYQDVRRNAMQAYIKYKAFYDKNANTSKLKETEYVYVIQPKADHHLSKIPFTSFRGIGHYINEKVLLNNNSLVRKIGTNKTQVLHRKRMRQSTPRQPPADIRILPRECKSDPELSLKHDVLYARAWDCEHEKPIFDAEKKMQRHSMHTIFQYSLIYQLRKRGTHQQPHTSVPEKFSPKRKNYVM